MNLKGGKNCPYHSKEGIACIQWSITTLAKNSLWKGLEGDYDYTQSSEKSEIFKIGHSQKNLRSNHVVFHVQKQASK